MNTPCPSKVNTCLPCNDWPLENLSIEAPDDPLFLATADWYAAKGCLRWCFSRISQADADACAAAQAAECADPSIKPGNNPAYNTLQRCGCGANGAILGGIDVVGPLPPGYTYDGTSLILPAGSMSISGDSAPDPQAAVDSLARQALLATFQALVNNGQITCRDFQWEWVTEVTSTHPTGLDSFGTVFVPGQTDLTHWWGSHGLVSGAPPTIVAVHAFSCFTNPQSWEGHVLIHCPPYSLNWDFYTDYHMLQSVPPLYIIEPSNLTSTIWRMNGTDIPATLHCTFEWVEYVGNGALPVVPLIEQTCLYHSYRFTTNPGQIFMLDWEIASSGRTGVMDAFLCVSRP